MLNFPKSWIKPRSQSENWNSCSTMFKNAKIVSVGTNPDVYHRSGSDVPRGHREFVMSNTSLGEFASNPHRWIRGYRRKVSKKQVDWGNLIDCMVLTPGQFDERFAVYPTHYPDSKTGEMKKFTLSSNWCKKWKEDHENFQCITKTDLDNATAARARLAEDPIIMEMLDGCQTQVFVLGEYHDPQTKIVVPVKCLIDVVPSVSNTKNSNDRCLADLKTCRHADKRSWERQVYLFGYHRQAALYMDLYTEATKEDRTDWRHIVSESEPPYEPARRQLSGGENSFIELGRNQVLSALRTYCACLEANSWPSWDDGSGTIQGWTLVSPEAWMVASSGAELIEPPDPEEDEEESELPS